MNHPHPQVKPFGETKTSWANFLNSCTTLKREPEHVAKFFFTETGSTGTYKNSLVFNRKLTTRVIENLLIKYISKYVKCQACGSIETTIRYDETQKMDVLGCTECGVSTIV